MVRERRRPLPTETHAKIVGRGVPFTVLARLAGVSVAHLYLNKCTDAEIARLETALEGIPESRASETVGAR